MLTDPDRANGRNELHWSAWLVHDRRMLVLVVGLVIVAGLSSLMVLPRIADVRSADGRFVRLSAIADVRLQD